MTGTGIFKRSRGRPRLENPADRKGLVRGIRQGVIDQARALCQEHDRDLGKEIEQFFLDLIQELAGPDALKQMVSDMMSKKLGLEERIAYMKNKIDDLEKKKSAGPPGGMTFEQAKIPIVERLCDPQNRANYLNLLEPNARLLAHDYPGRHWQTIKQELKKDVEEHLGLSKKEEKVGE